MKKLLLLALTAMAFNAADASTITFFGIVDQVPPGSPYAVNDPVTANFKYNHKTGVISAFDIMIGTHRLVTRGRYLGRVVYDNNPAHGSVYYQVVEADVYGISITLQASTPDGVILPISEFNLNDFILFGAFGHLAALPAIQP